MKNNIYIGIICLVLGWVLHWQFTEPKVIVETKVVEVEKIVTEVKERIVKSPDGTVTIDRETVAVEDRTTEAVKVEKPAKKDWLVSAKVDLFSPISVRSYQLEVSRRVFNDVYVGAYGRTDGTVGVGITVLF